MVIVVVVLIPVVAVTGNYFTGGARRIVRSFSPGTEHGGFYVNPPTIVDDHVYIGTSINSSQPAEKDNFFYKLDLDLEEIWQYKLDDYFEVQGGAALDSSKNIYFVVTKRTEGKRGSQESHLYSLTNNGKFRWKQKITYDNEKFDTGPTTPAIGTDDTIYIGHGKIFAFDPNGAENGLIQKTARFF